jgi:endoglucanase
MYPASMSLRSSAMNQNPREGVSLLFTILLLALSFRAAAVETACVTPCRGVNISGAEFNGGKLPGRIHRDFTYNSAKSFQYFAGKGITLIRIPFLWERIQPNLREDLDPENLNALKQDVLWAKEAGCRVVLDVHNYARYSLNENGSYHSYVMDNIYDGAVKVSAADLGDLWVRLSRVFKDETAVYAYGLMNEPHSMGTANWLDISQTVVTAIRKGGDNKLLMIPGNFWSGASKWTENNGPKSWIQDPANRFKYEAHLYFDRDSSGTYKQSYDQELAKNPELPMLGAKRVANFVNWCKANQVDGFIGEYGVPGNDERWNVVLDNFLKALDDAGFESTYWAAGEWWGDYPLSVQPKSGNTVDAPQMSSLLEHETSTHPVGVPAETR